MTKQTDSFPLSYFHEIYTTYTHNLVYQLQITILHTYVCIYYISKHKFISQLILVRVNFIVYNFRKEIYLIGGSKAHARVQVSFLHCTPMDFSHPLGWPELKNCTESVLIRNVSVTISDRNLLLVMRYKGKIPTNKL